jgi:hypothetical protein
MHGLMGHLHSSTNETFLNHPRMKCRSFQVVIAVVASGRIEVALEHPVTPNRNTWFRNRNEAGDIKFWCLYPSKFGHVGKLFQPPPLPEDQIVRNLDATHH